MDTEDKNDPKSRDRTMMSDKEVKMVLDEIALAGDAEDVWENIKEFAHAERVKGVRPSFKELAHAKSDAKDVLPLSESNWAEMNKEEMLTDDEIKEALTSFSRLEEGVDEKSPKNGKVLSKPESEMLMDDGIREAMASLFNGDGKSLSKPEFILGEYLGKEDDGLLADDDIARAMDDFARLETTTKKKKPSEKDLFGPMPRGKKYRESDDCLREPYQPRRRLEERMSKKNPTTRKFKNMLSQTFPLLNPCLESVLDVRFGCEGPLRVDVIVGSVNQILFSIPRDASFDEHLVGLFVCDSASGCPRKLVEIFWEVDGSRASEVAMGYDRRRCHTWKKLKEVAIERLESFDDKIESARHASLWDDDPVSPMNKFMMRCKDWDYSAGTKF